jgi:hypothetical protein
MEFTAVFPQIVQIKARADRLNWVEDVIKERYMLLAQLFLMEVKFL